MGKDIEEERLEVLINEIFEDFKWYKSAKKEGDEKWREHFKSFMRNLEIFFRELKKRNETLDNYPLLKELLKFKNFF
jgi:hypothetical protein